MGKPRRAAHSFEGEIAGEITTAAGIATHRLSPAWEAVKKKGDEAIEKWIDNQLTGTSVTVVLIGAETSERKYVGYEIKQSHNKGNGMLGIAIHNMRDVNSRTDTRGKNSFANWHVEPNGRKFLLSDISPVYDWVNDNGRGNIGEWIEAAANKAGK